MIKDILAEYIEDVLFEKDFLYDGDDYIEAED